ncbi:hypothetical protein ILYODFUR_022900 [Ilyodon furcidens]|uniref:Uncharacterized protein n=1 Tax=Ilyodon furcidens TaxID=33524 RepID=A0ABV0VGQ6_9TELE
MGTHAGRSGFSVRSVTDKPPGPPNTGRKGMFQMLRNCTRDDGSKPTPTMETHITSEGEGITAPTLWRKHLGYMENKQNSSTFRRQAKETVVWPAEKTVLILRDIYSDSSLKLLWKLQLPVSN